jgi:hypothetical protein
VWVAALAYWERRREHEDACLVLGNARYDGAPSAAEDPSAAGSKTVDADDVVNREYGSIGVWAPPPFTIMAHPGRRIHPEDDPRGIEILNPIAVEAAGFGVGRPLAQRSHPPRLLTVTERVLWSIGLGLACGCAISIKWTNLATPGMIALETFFALYFLREPAPIPDLLLMGGSAISVYTLWFYIHFQLLPRTGDGDAFMRVSVASPVAIGPCPRACADGVPKDH